MTFEAVLQKAIGMLRLCRMFIQCGKSKGRNANRLKTILDAELCKTIRSDYEPDEILSELVIALHTVWSRYKPEKGDFGPFLVASFYFEARHRFVSGNNLKTRLITDNDCKILAFELPGYDTPESWDEFSFTTPELQVFEPRDELILRMRFVEGLHIYEIAEELGSSTKTVQRSLNRTINIIRNNDRLKRHAAACGYIEE